MNSHRLDREYRHGCLAVDIETHLAVEMVLLGDCACALLTELGRSW